MLLSVNRPIGSFKPARAPPAPLVPLLSSNLALVDPSTQ